VVALAKRCLLLIRRSESDDREQALSGAAGKGYRAIADTHDLIIRRTL